MLISNEDIDFIKNNIETDIVQLSLRKHKYKDININFCIEQIFSRQKIQYKLPNYYSNFNIIFPNSISLQQSSSIKTADYKASLLSYDNSADLTGGLGIDSIAFSQRAKKHIYIEKDAELCRIFEHNAKVLNIDNIEIINADSIDILPQINCDFYFADPARRGNAGKKTFLFSDIIPNPIDILSRINCDAHKRIMLKLSPMLDIDYALKNLKFVSEVHTVAVDEELKELLIIIDKSKSENLIFIAYHNNKSFKSKIEFRSRTQKSVPCSPPLEFIYIPNPAIMKLSAFSELSVKFDFAVLAPNSHIFTSSNLIEDFPGKAYQVIAVEKYKKKDIGQHLVDGKANISARNFPLSPEDIKKDLKLKDGGDIYIFFTSDLNEKKIAVITKKVENSAFL